MSVQLRKKAGFLRTSNPQQECSKKKLELELEKERLEKEKLEKERLELEKLTQLARENKLELEKLDLKTPRW